MGRYTRLFVCAVVALVLVPSAVEAASLEKAKMLRRHRLREDAKREAIDVLFDKDGDGHRPRHDDRPGALALLGEMAMEEGNYAAALDAWRRLEKEYPDSHEWERVAALVPHFAEAAVEVGSDEVGPPQLRRMLSFGEFWAAPRAKTFTFDCDLIDPVEAAIYWYDRVVDECPGYDAGRVALEQKLLTIMGWDLPGCGGPTGMRADFARWFPVYEETFEKLEHEYPKALSLQGFRYQAAQALLREGLGKEARPWLLRIVDQDYDRHGFYRYLADRLLASIGAEGGTRSR